MTSCIARQVFDEDVDGAGGRSIITAHPGPDPGLGVRGQRDARHKAAGGGMQRVRQGDGMRAVVGIASVSRVGMQEADGDGRVRGDAHRRGGRDGAGQHAEPVAGLQAACTVMGGRQRQTDPFLENLAAFFEDMIIHVCLLIP